VLLSGIAPEVPVPLCPVVLPAPVWPEVPVCPDVPLCPDVPELFDPLVLLLFDCPAPSFIRRFVCPVVPVLL
jgi:hypothetical protein